MTIGCSRSSEEGPDMIELRFSQEPRVLLARFGAALTPESMMALDTLVVKFIADNGTADVIVDYSGVPNTDFPTSMIAEAARFAPRMMDRRRFYVADNAVIYGMCRLFSMHQEVNGFAPPTVVQTIAEALSALDATDATFTPVSPRAMSPEAPGGTGRLEPGAAG